MSPEQEPQSDSETPETSSKTSPETPETKLTPEQEEEVESLRQEIEDIKEKGLDSPGAISQLNEKIEALSAIFTPQPEEIQIKEKIQIKEEAELKELFGPSFLGTNETEQAYTLTSGEKLFDFTPEQQRTIQEKLQAKLTEPDIEQFLQTHTKEQLQQNYLFVLRCQRFSDNTPVTMKNLADKLQPDFTQQNQGKILWKVDWYANEDFYQQETTPTDFSWAIVKKEPVAKNQDYHTQEQTIKDDAQQNQLNPSKTQRRLAVEALSDSLTYFRLTRQRLLPAGLYDWTRTQASDGCLVDLGCFDADGFYVYRWNRRDSHGPLGVCPSR